LRKIQLYISPAIPVQRSNWLYHQTTANFSFEPHSFLSWVTKPTKLENFSTLLDTRAETPSSHPLHYNPRTTLSCPRYSTLGPLRPVFCYERNTHISSHALYWYIQTHMFSISEQIWKPQLYCYCYYRPFPLLASYTIHRYIGIKMTVGKWASLQTLLY
jgi:hypothetical protein